MRLHETTKWVARLDRGMFIIIPWVTDQGAFVAYKLSLHGVGFNDPNLSTHKTIGAAKARAREWTSQRLKWILTDELASTQRQPPRPAWRFHCGYCKRWFDTRATDKAGCSAEHLKHEQSCGVKP